MQMSLEMYIEFMMTEVELNILHKKNTFQYLVIKSKTLKNMKGIFIQIIMNLKAFSVMILLQIVEFMIKLT